MKDGLKATKRRTIYRKMRCRKFWWVFVSALHETDICTSCKCLNKGVGLQHRGLLLCAMVMKPNLNYCVKFQTYLAQDKYCTSTNIHHSVLAASWFEITFLQVELVLLMKMSEINMSFYELKKKHLATRQPFGAIFTVRMKVEAE